MPLSLSLIAGARPNFIKIAPLITALHRAQQQGASLTYRLIHTGQHYDAKLSDTFFEQLGIPPPDVNLNVGSGTQAEQTAHIMVGLERELLGHPTDVVLVVGDVNSTLAAAIVAKKLGLQLVHVEAGIRSGDMGMPEEINRLVTDAITDHFYTTTAHADANLLHQGVSPERIHRVGNVMIDTLLTHLPHLQAPAILQQEQIVAGNYLLLTLHRPSNVDEPQQLSSILQAIEAGTTGKLPVLFPVHPRTLARLQAGQIAIPPHLHLLEPLPYLEFIYLIKHAKAVLTDSGGIQEETTVLAVPCLTLRANTERPETVLEGTNELLGTNPNKLQEALQRVVAGQWKQGSIPALWDGHAAERIVQSLLEIYG